MLGDNDHWSVRPPPPRLTAPPPQALFRSGDVTRPYPEHVQKMASLGRSEVKVKVNCGSDGSATSASD